jgi:hypothetical protein
MSLYISDKGRIFAKADRTGAATKLTVSGENDTPGGTPQWRFEGGALVGANTFTKGARKVTVKFSDAFSRCSFDVVYGKHGGEPIMIFNQRFGHADEMLDTTVVSRECSVREGNVFVEP